MTTPGANPPGQANPGSQNVVIAAAPGDQLAEALAAALRNLGWSAVVTEQVEPYAREARACVALITPTSPSSPALAAPVAPLIPLVVGGAQLPPGPWAVPPIVFAGDPAQAARDIVTAANNLAGAPSPAGGYPAPGAGGTLPYMPAAPSQPLQSYGAPAYPTQPGYTAYPQGAAPVAPKKRRWPMIVGVIVGVVLLLCVVGGALAYVNLKSFVGTVSTGVSQTETASAATATPVATATPSVPTGFTTYTDSTNGYSIAYPQSWQKTTSGGGVIFLDLTAGAQLWLIPANTNIPQSQIKSTETQMFKSAGGSYTNVKGPTAVTYAGETWEQESADTSTQGQKLHAVVLITNHGSKAYMIFYAAAKTDFASLDTQDFQPMLNSLTFQS